MWLCNYCSVTAHLGLKGGLWYVVLGMMSAVWRVTDPLTNLHVVAMVSKQLWNTLIKAPGIDKRALSVYSVKLPHHLFTLTSNSHLHCN